MDKLFIIKNRMYLSGYFELVVDWSMVEVGMGENTVDSATDRGQLLYT